MGFYEFMTRSTMSLLVFAMCGLSGCGNDGDLDNGNADGDADADTDGDADGDTDTDSDADSDTDSDADSDADSDTDSDTDEDVVCIGTPTGSCGDPFCDLMPGCEVTTPFACGGEAEPCSAFDNAMSDCEDQWGCGEGGSGYCSNYDMDCYDNDTEQWCTATLGCWWNGGFCTGEINKECDRRLTMGLCEENAACYWTPAAMTYCDGVSTACESMMSSTCEMQSECSLTPATCSGTPSPCETLLLKNCLRQPGCALVSGVTDNITPTGASIHRPDLIFRTLKVTRGNSNEVPVLLVDMVEVNRGSQLAAAHAGAFFLSQDEIWDADDFALFDFTVDFEIPPWGFDGALLDGYLDMPDASELPAGNYYVIGVLDIEEEIEELEEANNVKVLPPVYVGPDTVDLSAGSLAHTLEETAAPEDTLEVMLTVDNKGTVEIEAAAVSLYLSEDETPDESDVAVSCAEEAVTLNLAPQASAEYTLSCTLPRVRGTFYLIAELDPDDLLGDANRVDNVVVADMQVTVAALAPDLTVTAVSHDPESVPWKGEITLSATVENIGADPSPATSVTFLADGTDTACRAVVDALTAGESVEVSTTCTLGSDIAGTLTLSAHVDPGDAIFEADEENNTLDADTTLTVEMPDINLTAAGVGIVAGGTTRSVGDELEVFFEIESNGNDDAPAFRFVIYASDDTDITEDDVEIGIFDVDAGQAAGTTTAGASTMCVVATMPAGDYYIGLIVDTNQDLPETDESDNTAVDTSNLLTVVE